MKNIVKISFVLSFFFNTLLQAQPIRILNHRFEFQGNDVNDIKEWKPIEGNGFTCSIDDSLSYEGGYSLKMVNHTGDKAALRQSISIEPAKPQKFILSVAIRTANIVDRVGCYINVWEGDKLAYFEDMADQKIDSTRDWQIYSTPVFITKKTNKLVVGVKIMGKGTAWFDKIRLDPYQTEQPTSTVAKNYVDEAVKLIRENALFRDSVNWQVLESNLPIFTEGVQTTKDCYPVIRYVLEQLGDQHSSLTDPEAANAWIEPKKDDEKYKIPFAFGETLHDVIGYIEMRRFSTGNQDEKVAFADSLHRLIKRIDERSDLKGWIVDLRDNTGGNAWPMLAGIGPILGEGVGGYFAAPKKTSKGYDYESWEYQYGVSISNKTFRKVEVTVPYKPKKDLPVAVLIGNSTASSGEVVVTSFKNHPRARLFGTATGGYSTANDIFDLSDKATIEITTAIYADRKKAHYGKKIYPDVVVENPNNIRTWLGDPVIVEAVKWLKK